MNRRRGRHINGVLLLDKPVGMSSNEALQKVRRLYDAKRAGHTGALDPLATGMLPICLGEATKFSQYLLNADKSYHVIARLGQRTNTSDAEGVVISESSINIKQQALNDALDHFRGETWQVPSMYSALKHQGRPLYDYARQGIDVERQARRIVIHDLQLIRWQGEELELRVYCSKGTYIRTLIDDLGEKLQCGAHVTALRRLQVGNYSCDKMMTLQQLYDLSEQAHIEGNVSIDKLDTLLLPMDSPAAEFPEVNLLNIVAAYFKQGQTVHMSGISTPGLVRVTEGDTRKFIGIGEVDNDGVAPRRLVVDYPV